MGKIRGLSWSGIRESPKVPNDKDDFNSILASIDTICKNKKLRDVIVGMEPTGHYWRVLENYMIMHEITVVMVNPYHTKRAKELDDNSQTKNDKKDALSIAKLVGMAVDQDEESYVELAVVDKAGRLQIPREYLEALGLKHKSKSRVELEEGRIVLLPPEEMDEREA